VRLCTSDVDLDRGVLTIERSKGRSRIVTLPTWSPSFVTTLPTGSDWCAVADERSQWPSSFGWMRLVASSSSCGVAFR
jgi:hypothetical protein